VSACTARGLGRRADRLCRCADRAVGRVWRISTPRRCQPSGCWSPRHCLLYSFLLSKVLTRHDSPGKRSCSGLGIAIFSFSLPFAVFAPGMAVGARRGNGRRRCNGQFLVGCGLAGASSHYLHDARLSHPPTCPQCSRCASLDLVWAAIPGLPCIRPSTLGVGAGRAAA